MPSKKETQSSGDLLADTLEAEGVSQRQLAIKLAGRDATHEQVEARRRLIQKWIRGDSTMSDDSAESVAAALKKPRDYFKTAAVQRIGRRDRLAELEAEVAQLRREFSAFVTAATERQAAREATPVPATRRSGRRSKDRRG